MPQELGRRSFLREASALGLGVGLGTSAVWRSITPARADDLVVGPEAVRFRPEIEPVVRWIEETPRETVIDSALIRLKEGLSYRDLMAGLFLAGIRNVKPRPVGFKFHAVLVINSAHLLAQGASTEDRLLPMFWALDNFKSSQAQDEKEGDWTLQAVNESRMPGPEQARRALEEAFGKWDAEAADAATAGLCRTAGAAETMEVFWRCAVRDQRNIGHKPIFAMQCWRTLQAVGWEHAEPVLRSLAFGLLDLQGDSTPTPLGPYESNVRRAGSMRADWMIGRPDEGATLSLLQSLRQAGPDEASAEVAKQIAAGVSPDSLWDAVLLAGNELLLCEPGIVPIHAVTAANALHFIYHASGDDTTRRLALLQAAGWIPLYRQRVGKPARLRIDALEPVEPSGDVEAGLMEAFQAIGKDRTQAASRVLGFLQEGGGGNAVFDHARRMILHKGAESHQYKYGAAVWEECRLTSVDRWRNALTAAQMAYVPGADASESPLMKRIRQSCAEVFGSTS